MSALMQGFTGTSGTSDHTQRTEVEVKPRTTYVTVQQFQTQLSRDWIAAVTLDPSFLTYQSLSKGEKSIYRERCVLVERFAELSRQQDQSDTP
jgi:hypothetical protein